MKIILIGCGGMGAGLTQNLTLHGHAVTVVDKGPAAFAQLGPSSRGRTVLGIGFDRDVLVEAGMERVDGLAAVTASDEADVVAARPAGQALRDLNLPAACILVAVLRKGQLILPRGNTVLQPADEVLAIVHPSQATRLDELLDEAKRGDDGRESGLRNASNPS